jgi:hypothetical protein
VKADMKIHKSVGAVFNACKLHLNNQLADEGLSPVKHINFGSPKQMDIHGKDGSPERTIGVYANGENIFQQDFEESRLMVTVDMILRDEDAEGTRQDIYKYADTLREFLNAQNIGLSCIVIDGSIIRTADDKRNRVYCVLMVIFDPMTDLDSQGLENPDI